jgi:hypothetical protein
MRWPALRPATASSPSLLPAAIAVIAVIAAIAATEATAETRAFRIDAMDAGIVADAGADPVETASNRSSRRRSRFRSSQPAK